MSQETRCPECGAPLPTRTPQGLCPGCLLKRGVETAPPASEAGQAGGDFTPPTPEQLAAHFPDLEILEFIGRGGMGMVYKARQKHLDRLVALKILLPNIARDPAFAERFAREARAMAMLSHPHIVTVYDFGQSASPLPLAGEGLGVRAAEGNVGGFSSARPFVEGGLYYFFMEFVDGLTLRQLLDAGKLAPREALAIVPQICEALQYAHDKGVVHRDIKPENILMDRSGQVKIADFGLAKLVGQDANDFSLTGAGQVMGTPQYMAPEQIEHPLDVDHRADIYSLGVVFYQMLTGELPMGRFAPPSKKVQIDVRLDEVVLRALEKEPQLRFQQASEVKTQVESIAATQGVSPAVPAADPPAWQSPTMGWGHFVGYIFGITFTSPLAYRVANLSALGFLGCLAFLSYLPFPGAHKLLGFSGFSGFFGLIGVAHMIEFAQRLKAKAAAGHVPPTAATLPSQAKPRKWWKRWWMFLLVGLLFAESVRTFVAEPFLVAGSCVEPELPRGSRILVWKLIGSLAAGDLVAYRHEDLTFVGRVASVNDDEIRIERNRESDEVVQRERVIGKVISVYWRPSIAGPRQIDVAPEPPLKITLDEDQLSAVPAASYGTCLPRFDVNKKTFGTWVVLDVTPNYFGTRHLKPADYGLPADASVESVAAKADQGDLYLTLPAKDGPAVSLARLVPLRGATLFPFELPRIESQSPNWSYADRLKRMSRSQIAAAGDAIFEAHPNAEDRSVQVTEGQTCALVRPDRETYVLHIGELSQNAKHSNRQLGLSMLPIGRIPWGTSFCVVDSQGKAVAGATATFSITEQINKVDGVATYQTRAMGTYQGDAKGCIQLPPLPRGTTIRGEVTAPGFLPRKYLDGSRDKDGRYYPPGVDGAIQLTRPAVIEGQVLGPDGKPLVHAPLSLTTSVEYPHASIFTANHLRAISDEQGRFRMEGVPPGKQILYYPWSGPTQGEVDSGRWQALGMKKVDHRGELPLPLVGYGLVKPITVEESSTVKNVLLDFSQSTSAIEGKVLDVTGKPVSGASVRLLWPRGDGVNWMGLDLPETVSDPAGHYRIDHLPPGSFQIQAIPPGMKVAPENSPAPVRVELPVHHVLRQDLRLALAENAQKVN